MAFERVGRRVKDWMEGRDRVGIDKRGPDRAIYPWDDFEVPDVDIKEMDNELIILMDLPGIEKEDITLKLTEDRLEVKAEKREEDEEEGENYYSVERTFKGFRRVIDLPTFVDPDDASASFKNGVLEVRATKTEEDEGNTLEIE